MRVSVAAIFVALLGGCEMPRPIPPETYRECPKVEAGEPPLDSVLFITLRQPACPKAGVVTALTDYRARKPLYVASRNGMFTFYEPDQWVAGVEREHGKKERPLVVFIHGYRNSNAQALQTAWRIQEAARETAPVVAVTWPSYRKFAYYLWDETNAEWASEVWRSATLKLGSKFPHMIIIAHSMGNRLALGGLNYLKEQGLAGHVDRLVMASPDVDRATLREQLAKGIGTAVTIYGSRKDQALSLSWRDHSYPRGGDLSWWVEGRASDYTLAWLNGVEVIDTTDIDHSVDGHSAFIETREGREDLCRVIHSEGPERPGIAPLHSPGNYYRLIRTPVTDQCSSR